jgi:hypothetical protein
MSAPLFRRLLGRDIDALPAVLRHAHDGCDRQVWEGRADVTASRHPIARLLCRMMRLPRPGRDMPVTVIFERVGRDELWHRDFAGRRYRSRLTARRGLLVERMGPATNIFRVGVAGERLVLELVGFRFLGLPLPARLRPVCDAVESATGGRYRFDVPVGLPWLGQVIRYTGIIERSDG